MQASPGPSGDPSSCDPPCIPLSPAEDEPLLPEIPKCDANVLDTAVVIPGSWLSNTFRSILTHRAFVSQFHNFLLGLQLHTDYLQNSQFSMWRGNPPWQPAPAWIKGKCLLKLPWGKDDHVRWGRGADSPRGVFHVW